MITVITGHTTLGWIHLQEALKFFKEDLLGMSELACGCAPGIEREAYRHARENQMPITFFPGWTHHKIWALAHRAPDEDVVYPEGGYGGSPHSYGYLRNRAITEYAEAVLSIWDSNGRGNGERGMIGYARRRNLKLMIYRLDRHTLEHHTTP